MFTCGITPRNDFIFPLDRCIKAGPVLPQTVTLRPVPTCMYGWTASQYPQESPGPLCSAHNTLSVWKTPLGTFPVTGVMTWL